MGACLTSELPPSTEDRTTANIECDNQPMVGQMVAGRIVDQGINEYGQVDSLVPDFANLAISGTVNMRATKIAEKEGVMTVQRHFIYLHRILGHRFLITRLCFGWYWGQTMPTQRMCTPQAESQPFPADNAMAWRLAAH